MNLRKFVQSNPIQHFANVTQFRKKCYKILKHNFFHGSEPSWKWSAKANNDYYQVIHTCISEKDQ